MPFSPNYYAEMFREVLGNIGDIPMGFARLGRGDGSGVIISDAANRTAYIFDTNVGSEAKLDREMMISGVDIPNNEGLRVELGYPRYEPKVLHILGVEAGEGMKTLGGVTLNEQRTTAIQYPDVGRILDFRLSPNNPLDLNIYVNPSPYYDLDGVWHFFGGDGLDDGLSTEIAALSGEHQLAVVYFDVTTAELGVVTSAAEAGDDSNKDFYDATAIADLTFDAGWILVGAVHLYDGQTEITEDDIYRTFDPRVIFPTPQPAAVQFLLEYNPSADIASSVALSATTWTDLCTNQNFTVADATDTIEIAVSGAAYIGTTASLVSARINIDSAGTPITRVISGSYVPSSGYTNALAGAGVIKVTGLSAGVHTIKVQVWSVTTNTLICEPTTRPNTDSLTVLVKEYSA